MVIVSRETVDFAFLLLGTEPARSWLTIHDRTLLTSSAGLEHAKQSIAAYKQGKVVEMTPELWKAKKTIDSTLHPDTGQPVFLPFRMSCFVLSNLIVTAGMLTPGLGVCSPSFIRCSL